MKITFVVPELNLSGGLRVIAIHAEYLASKGHQVQVISPARKKIRLKERAKSLLRGTGWFVKSKFNDVFFRNLNVSIHILDKHRNVEEKDTPDADVLIATFWTTAEWIKDFSESKGKKYYFVQHHEIHPWMPEERVRATLRFPYRKLVVSQWLKDILEDEYQQDSTLVLNGVDLNQFSCSMRNKGASPTIGFLYSQRSYKGSDIAISAINILSERFSNLKVVAFGTEMLDTSSIKCEDVEYYLSPPQNKISKIYGKCDAWLFCSRTEGFGLPILEAMACGTPLVATKAGVAPEMLMDHPDLLVDIDDTESLAIAAAKVLSMESKKWSQLSSSMLSVAHMNSWENSSYAFEKAIQ